MSNDHGSFYGTSAISFGGIIQRMRRSDMLAMYRELLQGSVLLIFVNFTDQVHYTDQVRRAQWLIFLQYNVTLKKN